MTAQPVETPPRVQPLNPASPAGRAAAEKAGVICAAVIDRLRREGRPIPGESTDPSP